MTRTPASASSAPDTRGSEDRWLNEEIAELASAFVSLRTRDDALRFLRDLCTVNELQELGQRWHVARLLDDGVSYHDISERTGASSATISRVGQWLRYGRDGYRLVIDRSRRHGRGHAR
jgi:TrpR-related protein YerC/YecD